MRRALVILVAVGAVAAGGACSLGDKQAMTNRVIRAAALVGAGRSVEAVMVINVKVIPSKLPIAPGPPKIVSNTAPGVKTLIDFKSGRAAVGYASDPAKAAMVFIGSRVYQRTGLKAASGPIAGVIIGTTDGTASGSSLNPSALGSLGAAGGTTGIDTNLPTLASTVRLTPPTTPAPSSQSSPSTALPAFLSTTTSTTSTTSTTAPAAGSKLHRPIRIQREWIEFDYSALPKRDKTKSAGSFAISPIVIERLLLGTLTGSIRRKGTETFNGVPVVHSTMNVSRDKTERLVPEKVRQDLEKMFRANAIGQRVFKAETWVDGAGHLLRFTITMRQTLSRIDRADLEVSVAFSPAPVAVTVPTPDPKTTAVVKQLGQLIHGAVAS